MAGSYYSRSEYTPALAPTPVPTPSESKQKLPTLDEVCEAAAKQGPRSARSWWSATFCGGPPYTVPNTVWQAVYAGTDQFEGLAEERPYSERKVCLQPSPHRRIERVAAPMALPGQYVVFSGQPQQITSIKLTYQDTDSNSPPGRAVERSCSYYGCSPQNASWLYTMQDGRTYWGHELEPHPRPDQGGSVLSATEVAKLEVLRLSDQRLGRIADATAQTLQLQQQTARMEEARQKRIEQEERDRKKAEAEKKKAEEEQQRQATSPIRILEETAEGAKDGAAAAAFVYASRKLMEAWPDHIPAAFKTERGRAALPWLLCMTTYLSTLLLPGFPMGDQVRAISLRATRGSASLLMAHWAESITPLLDRIIERGKTLLEKTE